MSWPPPLCQGREERVEAVRALIGDDVDLMVDANMAWDAGEALERGRRLERFDLYWYEEPTIPEDVPGHARISRELDIPVAVGESLHSLHEFRRYVDEEAAGILQIDPITNGGITASVEALKMADEAGLPTSSHYTDELSAHLLCASKAPSTSRSMPSRWTPTSRDRNASPTVACVPRRPLARACASIQKR
jgi:L-alanine-DL-glutamate epimerase-like enolase superfamily enzyme